ncbi:putative ABC transport system permease protein [Thermoflavifilum aggregans]|uniref:Putative ABC transport system permease protein n=1 Tax=Thermoflavifilum aggregans TaxID=454188 RepID=A0A2M9CTL7_9BACT|nr:ABC transporter permease [Thermoflavifilum aggregans]MBX6379726.1 ABC transporter permease [Thermoflavifilum aggregans]PJJ75158.1 putative ABC transport system permease protein [Thermoflavifilum aggregans]
MQFSDNLFLAFRSVKGNRLRTGLTIAIIALGITALVGIITAIESIRTSIYNNFARMGANGFVIRSWEMRIFFGGSQQVQKGSTKQKVKTSNRNQPITYDQALAFKQRFRFPAVVSISYRASGTATVYFEDQKTNPNVTVMGADENYVKINGFDFDAGRNLNPDELQSGANVAVIGHDIAQKLFGSKPSQAIGKDIRIGMVKYRVVGVMKSVGNTGIFSADNLVILPLNNVRRVYTISSNSSFQIGVMVPQIALLNTAIDEATGTFRLVRHLALNEADNFYITRSDTLADMLFGSLKKVRFLTFGVGLITLLGSIIGLMNIMLVAVAERTREIGVSKAIGATAIVIRNQFLYESILISLLGGALGIVFGIAIGNLVSLLLHAGFIVPWLWIGGAIALCAAVGLLAGVYPAMKAARLDPIVALRYE